MRDLKFVCVCIKSIKKCKEGHSVCEIKQRQKCDSKKEGPLNLALFKGVA